MFDMNWRGFRVFAWIGIALLAAAIAVVALRGEWLRVLVLVAFLVVSVIFVQRDRKMPDLFDAIFVIAALINAAGCTWNLYNKPGPYDEIAHFVTMFSIALAAGFLLYNELMEGFYGRRVMFVVTITSLGIAIGALWEVAEWTADFFTSFQIVSGLFDTMTDIILDTVGSLLAALLCLHGLNERAQAQIDAQPEHAGERASQRSASLP
jgi:hypothetical protein